MPILKDQFDPSLREKIKKKKIAVIPVGSIEQHGPHLPISTDSDIVTEVSKRIAEKEDYFLLPTISYGVSFEHAPFFNLSITNSTLQKLLLDICAALKKNGMKTVFVINGHHGNQRSMQNLNRKLLRTRVFFFSYWHFMKTPFDHAGFAETSLMLAISKNVKMNQAKRGLVTEGMSQKEITKLGRLASKSFPKVTKNGIWGDPTKATKKDGEKMLAEITKNLQKKCQTCLTVNKPKLHQ